MEYFDEGDRVVYFPTGVESNPTSGVIKKIIRKKKREEMPRYVIENDETHKETAYKLENIIKKYDAEQEKTGDLEIEIETETEEDEENIEVEIDDGDNEIDDDDDDVYDPNAENEEEDFEEDEEELDEKEYIRDICID